VYRSLQKPLDATIGDGYFPSIVTIVTQITIISGESAMQLKDKTALVTGASRGIGAAVAKRLAREGAKIAVVYGHSQEKAETVAKQIREAGGTAVCFQADFAKPELITDLLKNVVNEFGRLDILVNNAGVFEAGGLIGEIDLAGLTRTIDINIRSLFLLTQEAAKHLPSGGRIINVSSCLGERAIFAGASVYNMSKFAVSGLTRSWAWDLAPRNITVNAVLPGPIDTDMGSPGAAGLTAMKRMGTAEEVAAAVAFLATPEASYITGAQLAVDGGLNA
jgi:3-oxoacyl-[acyl-carrier protein] reductase